jgi:hypothetical protein
MSDLITRFLAKTEPGPGDCWTWIAHKDKDGYARFQVNRKARRAYRWSYEYHIGPIPDGLVLDHLCRNRACVNPWHLEPVTNLVNIQRGERPNREACIHGHPLDEANTYWPKNRGGQRVRACRECNRLAVRRYREKRSQRAVS